MRLRVTFAPPRSASVMRSARYHYRVALKRQMARAEMLLIRMVGRGFREESSPQGRWAPLSAMRIAQRLAGMSRGRGIRDIRILRDTGMMAASVGGSGNAYSHRLLRPDRLEVGTTISYGYRHQFGEPASRLPARPWLSLWPQEREEITNRIRQTMISVTVLGGRG